MQSISLSLVSRNLGCSHPRFSSRRSLVMVGKNCIASKNGPSCSTMRWMVALPISILVDKVSLRLRSATAGCQIGMFQPVGQIDLAGCGFQHDRSARERIDAIGERQ